MGTSTQLSTNMFPTWCDKRKMSGGPTIIEASILDQDPIGNM